MESRPWTSADVPRQDGRRFVITGANVGLGYELAKLLARRGGHVVLACRNQVKGATAQAEIRAVAPDVDIELGSLDLASLDSVRAFADWLGQQHPAIDVLVNNAGVMALPTRQETADGFEMQLGTNHLGHFALTGRLLPTLLAGAAPRVVTVSSMAHRSGRVAFDDLQSERRYKRMTAYGQSKLANLLFTMELQRRFDRAGVDAMAVAAHPGYARSKLGAGAAGNPIEAMVIGLGERVAAQSTADGAVPLAMAATDPEAKGGDYYGPSQFFGWRGPATKFAPARRAFDVHDARALWERSVELTGIDFTFS